jgi:sugar phosphate permease
VFNPVLQYAQTHEEIAVGIYSDRSAKRSIVVSAGLAATALTIAALPLAHTYHLLLTLSFLAGVAASTTLVTEHYPQKTLNHPPNQQKKRGKGSESQTEN